MRKTFYLLGSMMIASSMITASDYDDDDDIISVCSTSSESEVEDHDAQDQYYQNLCKNGDLETIKQLVEKGTLDVNYQDSENNTLFFHAFDNNQMKIVKVLISHPDFDVDLSDGFNNTPLYHACNRLDIPLIKAIFQHKGHKLSSDEFDLNDPSSSFYNLMEMYHKASSDEKLSSVSKAIELFLKHPHIKKIGNDDENIIPLHVMASIGCVIGVRHFLGDGKDPYVISSDKDTPLHLSIDSCYDFQKFSKERYLGCVKLLVEAAKTNNSENYFKYFINHQNNLFKTPLSLACQFGQKEIVDYLLQFKDIIDPNIRDMDGNTALHLASMGNYVEIVRLLLKHPKIDLNIQNNEGKTALAIALEKKDFAIAQIIFDCEDAKSADNSLSHEGTQKLIINPSDITKDEDCEPQKVSISNQSSSSSSFFAFPASYYQHLENQYIESKENSEVTDGAGLLDALRKKNFEGAQALLTRANIDVNYQNNQTKNTALICACVHAAEPGFKEIVKDLLSKKEINVNLQNNFGNTALIYALDRRHINIAQALLQRLDIDVNLKNNKGQTAQNFLKRCGVETFEDLLRYPQKENKKSQEASTAVGEKRGPENQEIREDFKKTKILEQ